MNGLDKLQNKITEDAKLAAEDIIAAAKKIADETVNSAKEDAKGVQAEILMKAEKKADEILKGARSDANLEGKKMLLSKKQGIIDGVFKKASEIIASLSNEEYFEIIYALVKKNVREAELLLSENDKSRKPADFEDKIKALSNGKITVSQEWANIENGFILKNDSVEENCSFDAIIQENAEKLKDETAKLLFS